MTKLEYERRMKLLVGEHNKLKEVAVYMFRAGIGGNKKVEVQARIAELKSEKHKLQEEYEAPLRERNKRRARYEKSSFAHCFLEEAKSYLTPAMFNMIVNRARERAVENAEYDWYFEDMPKEDLP